MKNNKIWIFTLWILTVINLVSIDAQDDDRGNLFGHVQVIYKRLQKVEEEKDNTNLQISQNEEEIESLKVSLRDKQDQINLLIKEDQRKERQIDLLIKEDEQKENQIQVLNTQGM